jgi:hypothetical protein
MQADELAVRGDDRVLFRAFRVIDPVARVDPGTCEERGNRAWLDIA